MTTGNDELRLLLAQDTSRDAEEQCLRRVKRERSFKTSLPSLSYNRDAISPRCRAPAYIKYAQSVSSKYSNSTEQKRSRHYSSHKGMML
ncbi:uncharacterized protein N7506_005436 [Penicillium brevicompactum]|uniref:uncharacterized protein n=1 Tax=Penicillium brevicompactum TaxID=5074 RepID=UPI0025422F50|nr:uncharacterized protein N7506_005436 [Penicillium brevicompactum]KAJ5337414.1 hypothetical protein N7506_005436 [Penicillium brevicompactum]